MNTCIVCLGEENSTDMVEYNHCGLYHIHRECLKNWQTDECIICREKIITVNNYGESNNFNWKTCIALSVLCPILSTLLCVIVIILI